MDAKETCESLLSYIKKSNLNWNIVESPFSVTITLRKSFIKNKDGSSLKSGLDPLTKIVQSAPLIMLQPSQIHPEQTPLHTSMKQQQCSTRNFMKPTLDQMKEFISPINLSTFKPKEDPQFSPPKPIKKQFSMPYLTRNTISSAMKQDSMSYSRVLTNIQGISHTHSERLSTTLGVNYNTSDDDYNPQLSSEPNVIIQNRFKTLENLSEDSCEKEQGVAYRSVTYRSVAYRSVATLKEVDKEENNDNEQSIEITRLGSKS